MYKSLKQNRKLNGSITKRVIELHGQGYDHDFQITGNKALLCLQNNKNFPVDAVCITVVDQGFDQLTQSYKYIHTIDTDSGERGMLVTDCIFIKPAVIN